LDMTLTNSGLLIRFTLHFQIAAIMQENGNY